MTDDDQSANDGIIHYEGGVPIVGDRLDKVEHEQEAARKRDQQYKDGQLKTNRRMVLFTGVLAFCSILGGIISAWQAHIASRTIGEMQAARKQTKADNANAITAQQAIAQDSLAKSQTNFEKTSQNAENAFRADQRAWIGISAVNGEPTANEIWKINIVYRNSGRTPARNLRGHTVFDPIKRGDEPHFSYAGKPGFKGGMMTPSGDYSVTLIPTRDKSTGKPVKMTQPILDEMTAGAEKDFVHGEITYDDVFGCRHWMTFCYFWNVDMSVFSACTPHNDTGDYKCRK